MQKIRSVTIKTLSRAFSSLAILLLIGLHPVQAFADTGSGTATSPTTGVTPDTTTDATISPQPTTTTTDTSSAATDPTTNSSNQQAPNTQVQTESQQGNTTPNTDTQNYSPASNNSSNDSTETTDTNNVDSTAKSGNATVADSGTAGGATSGKASAIATLLNELGTSTSFSDNGGFITFTTEITGNTNGNVTIDPSKLAQPTSSSAQNNTQLNATNSGEIDNNVNLSATSGNATVKGNGTAGNATSGNADAVANIVNLINDAIAANKSFLGVINIYGNLTGNILVPSQFLNSLLPSSDASSSAPATNTNINNNQSIDNEVTATATSGNATVSNNGTAGNATSGNASTNVNIFNLANDTIVGSNVLLVFVNVLGTWVGLLMNAPAGTTSAAFGGGITQDSTSRATPGVTDATVTNNEIINNNVSVAAATGDATVAGNDVAGNATTGNASASVNLLNILGSQFSLANWFGVLFINVFGSWHGNFEVATPAVQTNGSGKTTTSSEHHRPAVVAFLASTGDQDLASAFPQGGGGQPSSGNHVLGATTSDDHTKPTPGSAITAAAHSSRNGIIVATLLAILLGVFAAERALTIRRRHLGQLADTSSSKSN